VWACIRKLSQRNGLARSALKKSKQIASRLFWKSCPGWEKERGFLRIIQGFVTIAAIKRGGFEMSKITPAVQHWDDTDEADSAYTPLTGEQAKLLREHNPPVSPWWVIAAQLGVGFWLALAAWVLTGRPNVVCSTAYGAMVVIVPSALFAWGLMNQRSVINTVMGGFGFVVWEAIKIAASIAMLFAASHLVADLDWLALLIGLVVTLKVYWVALLMRRKRKTV
jgi:ATP synthase protein I